jgi:hypothetical protein
VLSEELRIVERGTDGGAVRLDVLVVAAMGLAHRGAGRSAVRLDVLVLGAAGQVAHRRTSRGTGRSTDRNAVRFDVVFLWLNLLTWLVRHLSSFRNFAVD